MRPVPPWLGFLRVLRLLRCKSIPRPSVCKTVDKRAKTHALDDAANRDASPLEAGRAERGSKRQAAVPERHLNGAFRRRSATRD